MFRSLLSFLKNVHSGIKEFNLSNLSKKKRIILVISESNFQKIFEEEMLKKSFKYFVKLVVIPKLLSKISKIQTTVSS